MYWIDPDWGSHGNALEVICNFTVQETCIKSPHSEQATGHEKVNVSAILKGG